MDTHIRGILGTSMGTRMASPYGNLFMSKEERTIILTFLNLNYFWKRFIDDIFFIFLGSHSQLKSLMTFMNTIKFTFLNLENSRQNSIKNQPTAWHYFTLTLTIHSAVKHLFPSTSIQHNHFKRPHPAGTNQQPNTHSTGSRISTTPHH